MRKLLDRAPLCLLLFGLWSVSCGTPPDADPRAGVSDLSRRYLAHWFQTHPERATAEGVHDYDDRLAPSSKADFDAEAAALRRFLAEAEALPEESLDRQEQVDLRLLVSDIRVRLARLERERDWRRDPTLYIPFQGLNDLIRDEFAPAPVRAASLLARLRQVPRVVSDARANLENPPRLFTETAIRTVRDLIPFYETTVPEFAASVPELEEDLNLASREAAAALADYLRFLEVELAPRSDGDLAIGRELYDFYLRELHMLEDDADSLLVKAERYFAEAEAELASAAAALDPSKSWQALTEQIRDRHPSREGLLDAYCDEIQRSRRHVLEKGLVTLPAGEEVRCMDTPPAQRAFSPFGDFRSPAPFSDQKIGWLSLHPIEPGLAPEAEEKLLRAHDYTWIAVIAPHEAYPGHHVQALKAQENPRPLRKVYRSPLFSEGWGLYCEELAYETGFYRDPEATRLTQLRLRLWRAARVILDASLHTGRMSYDEARRFLVDKIRFEESSTAGEVNIYAFRPTYAISYIVGYREIMKLREEYRERRGEEFSLREFHDRLLGQGEMPFRLLRGVVLE